MTRQGYLEIIHHKDCDVPYKEIKWGGRAKLELNKKEIIEFVCKVSRVMFFFIGKLRNLSIMKCFYLLYDFYYFYDFWLS